MSGYVTGDHNRLLSDGTYSYTYDEEGNRTTRTNIVTGTVETYTWDHRNRLVSVVTTDSQAVALREVEFAYDAFDRRVEKRVDLNADSIWESYERFVYDGQHIALVFDEAGSLTNRYLHGPATDQILANEQVVNGITDEVLWALTDHLGSVRHLVDNTGDVVNDRVYDSFGRLLSESDPSVKHRFGFTGREWDAELSLNYHRARYYDVGVGKWISEDPIGFTAGDANLGRYVGNESQRLTDPTGKQPPNIDLMGPVNELAQMFDQALAQPGQIPLFPGSVTADDLLSEWSRTQAAIQALRDEDIDIQLVLTPDDKSTFSFGNKEMQIDITIRSLYSAGWWEAFASECYSMADPDPLRLEDYGPNEIPLARLSKPAIAAFSPEIQFELSQGLEALTDRLKLPAAILGAASLLFPGVRAGIAAGKEELLDAADRIGPEGTREKILDLTIPLISDVDIFSIPLGGGTFGLRGGAGIAPLANDLSGPCEIEFYFTQPNEGGAGYRNWFFRIDADYTIPGDDFDRTKIQEITPTTGVEILY